MNKNLGVYYTPLNLMQMMHDHIAIELGSGWQDEYYVWDCAAGTGNLLYGLTNKENIFASTIESEDIIAMQSNGDLGMKKENVFQFDFLNDSFDKLPLKLKSIIENEEQRKRLIILMNPPYIANNVCLDRIGLARLSNCIIYKKYNKEYKEPNSINLFTLRLYIEIPGCHIFSLATVDYLFNKRRTFREKMGSKIKILFGVEASIFEDIKSAFAINFSYVNEMNDISPPYGVKYYDKNLKFVLDKTIWYSEPKMFPDYCNERNTGSESEILGFFIYDSHILPRLNLFVGTDYIYSSRFYTIRRENLLIMCVLSASLAVMPAEWTTKGNRARYPTKPIDMDSEFVADCYLFSMFHFQNRAKSKLNPLGYLKEFTQSLNISEQGKVVIAKAKAIQDYCINESKYQENFGWFNVRTAFKEFRPNGKMKARSKDRTFNTLEDDLKQALQILGKNIYEEMKKKGIHH